MPKEACSEELHYLVNNMLVVDPKKRIKLQDVVKVCDSYLEKNKKSGTNIDCFTVSEDINEKLMIIDFDKYFCIPQKYVYNKYYFTKEKKENDKDNTQFIKFCQILLWLIYIIKNVSF